MRTTLAIDDDILLTAKAIADRERRSIGQVVSDLARLGIKSRHPSTDRSSEFPTLPRRGVVVTLDIVNALRDEDE